MPCFGGKAILGEAPIRQSEDQAVHTTKEDLMQVPDQLKNGFNLYKAVPDQDVAKPPLIQDAAKRINTSAYFDDSDSVVRPVSTFSFLLPPFFLRVELAFLENYDYTLPNAEETKQAGFSHMLHRIRFVLKRGETDAYMYVNRETGSDRNFLESVRAKQVQFSPSNFDKFKKECALERPTLRFYLSLVYHFGKHSRSKWLINLSK